MEAMNRLFRSYSEYLRERYGVPVYRVAIDAGFSCPHRGPDRSRPGCLYCDGSGARAPYLEGAAGGPPSSTEDSLRQNIRRQIETAVGFLRRRYRAEQFLLYFQAFTNTYAPPPELARIYDFALACAPPGAPFRELIVSTRPDCIDAAKADMLSAYRERSLEVWVELGLQSASDATLRRIRRGHTVREFTEAYELLRSRGLKLAAHLIFGLPGEGLEEILNTVRYLAALEPDGVKIHNLHVPKASPLAEEYAGGELAVPCAPRHLEYVIRSLELLPPRTLIMRLTCDTPRDRLAAPLAFAPKARFYQELRRRMEELGSRQGRFWTPTGGASERSRI